MQPGPSNHGAQLKIESASSPRLREHNMYTRCGSTSSLAASTASAHNTGTNVFQM